MKISYKTNSNEVVISIEGSINSKTAEEFEKGIEVKFDSFEKVVLDFSGVDYLSSAGLRVILSYENKAEEEKKSFSIANANDEVKEVFEITGFSTFLNIE